MGDRPNLTLYFPGGDTMAKRKSAVKAKRTTTRKPKRPTPTTPPTTPETRRRWPEDSHTVTKQQEDPSCR